MTKEQIEQLQYLGFAVSEEDERGNIAIESDSIPDLERLELLIAVMTFKEEIHYWDAFKKSPSDPGGYVSAIRWDEENVAYMEGNHGWTSRWQIVPITEMAAHMQKNWDKDCDRGKYLNKVFVSQNSYTTRERIKKNLE